MEDKIKTEDDERIEKEWERFNLIGMLVLVGLLLLFGVIWANTSH